MIIKMKNRTNEHRWAEISTIALRWAISIISTNDYELAQMITYEHRWTQMSRNKHKWTNE